MSSRDSFIDKEKSFQGHYSTEVFETLKFGYLPVLPRIAVFLAAGFLGRLLIFSNANLIGFWVDTFCGRHATDVTCNPVPAFFATLGDQGFLWLLVTVTLSGFVLTTIYRIGFSRASAVVVSGFYDEVTLRTSRLPIKFFDTNPVGRIVTRFSSDYGNIFRLFGGPLAEFIAIIFDLTCMMILIGFASPYYLPLIIAIGALNYLIYRLNRDRLRHERRGLSFSRSPSIAHFAETTQGASTIRIFGRQGVFARRFRALNDQYLKQRLRTTGVVSLFSIQMSATTALLLLATGLLGYFLSKSGHVSVGSIGVAFTFVVLSGTSMQMFFEWMAQFEEAMTGVERLDDYLRRPLEQGAKLPAQRQYPTSHPVYAANEEAKLRGSKLLMAASASVDIEDLWFRYDPELPYVLKGLNLKIQPGEKIGIVGRTGSGKSSFVQALFRLYPLERGRIAIDGREATTSEDTHDNVDLQLYRRSIALISQEPTLFRGTVRENLDLLSEHEDAALLQALTRVGLDEWIEAMPHGLAGLIEERGRNLSAGEKQLLCMARCLLQDAPVVVMDEATSAVDPQSEEILVRATEKFFADRTQIIIAHRLSTLENCDRILWLHHGEVRMFDIPSKLLPVFRAAELA